MLTDWVKAKYIVQEAVELPDSQHQKIVQDGTAGNVMIFIFQTQSNRNEAITSTF